MNIKKIIIILCVFILIETATAEVSKEQFDVNQQSLIMALGISDLNKNNGLGMNLPSVLSSISEIVEDKNENIGMFLAKVTGSYKFVNILGRLRYEKEEDKRGVMLPYVNQDWNQICYTAYASNVLDFSKSPSDYNVNQATYILNWTRLLIKSPKELTKKYKTFYLDLEDATSRISGSSKNVSCEDLWSYHTKTPLQDPKTLPKVINGERTESVYPKNLSTRDIINNQTTAAKICSPFHQIVKCVADLELKVEKALVEATINNQNVNEEWRKTYYSSPESANKVHFVRILNDK